MNAPLHCLRHERGADTLLVLLPGAYMTAQHFADNGFSLPSTPAAWAWIWLR